MLFKCALLFISSIVVSVQSDTVDVYLKTSKGGECDGYVNPNAQSGHGRVLYLSGTNQVLGIAVCTNLEFDKKQICNFHGVKTQRVYIVIFVRPSYVHYQLDVEYMYYEDIMKMKGHLARKGAPHDGRFAYNQHVAFDSVTVDGKVLSDKKCKPTEPERLIFEHGLYITGSKMIWQKIFFLPELYDYIPGKLDEWMP